MKFTTAAGVERICWDFRLADFPRAQNRALINGLFNGEPPFTEQEQAENNQGTNVNDLSATKINHDARSQFDNAFLAPNPLFSVSLDYGPSYKRLEWGGKITKHINKIVLSSPKFFDLRQGVFASVVLHGVGPAMWEDKQKWCPTELGVEDVLVPSNTLSNMSNLPFFAIWRSYTINELWKMTHGFRVDPGWNMTLVEKCLEWVTTQSTTLVGQNWPQPWQPEKLHERLKQDGGSFASDAVPTIDTFDFYFWNDEKGVSGWNRRIILDAWSEPGTGGVVGFDPKSSSFDSRKRKHGKGEFLYDSGDRKYSDNISKIIHFQFGDASPVSPFRYHSRRSLGFLLYSVCELQNRLKCRFNDAVFESMLQYFRVANPADMDRLTKIDLADRGILPEGLNFVKPEERWQLQEAIVQNALQMNRQMMADVSASFIQDLDMEGKGGKETATRTMAKVNQTAALMGAILNRAYERERFRYIEICRRFCIKRSRDLDVQEFRLRCLKDGIPEEALNSECWDIQPNRVIGQGNKMLQVAIADKIQAIRPQLEPQAQKEADRLYISANTNDWNLTNRLVPETHHVTDSVMAASSATGTLMAGVMVPIQEGINQTEYIETLLTNMAMVIKRIESSGGMATQQEIVGLQAMAVHVQQHIQILAQDKNEKASVKQYGDFLGQFVNNIKAYSQRLQEQSQQQNGQGGIDPKDQAKVAGMLITAKAKADIQSKSHAQKTAQRQVQFEQKFKQDEQKANLEIRKQTAAAAIDLQAEHTKNRMKSFEE